MSIGFLGYGNLAKALTRGLCRPGGALSPAEITVTAHSDATINAASAAGHDTCPDAAALFAKCDTVVLAVKPRVFREIAPALRECITPAHRVVSVMCAVHIDEIAAALGCPVMRVMPTLAAADACDILGYTIPDGADFSDLVPLLASLGDALPMNEPMLDRLTVAASCGLGVAAHILEAYKRECMALGFDSAQSDAIVRRMFVYAAECGRDDPHPAPDDSFTALERRVATRGGATEAGNLAMDADLRRALSACFGAAGERAIPRD